MQRGIHSSLLNICSRTQRAATSAMVSLAVVMVPSQSVTAALCVCPAPDTLVHKSELPPVATDATPAESLREAGQPAGCCDRPVSHAPSNLSRPSCPCKVAPAPPRPTVPKMPNRTPPKRIGGLLCTNVACTSLADGCSQPPASPSDHDGSTVTAHERCILLGRLTL